MKGEIYGKKIRCKKSISNLMQIMWSLKSLKTKAWPSLFNSFLVGGLICMLGQLINDLFFNGSARNGRTNSLDMVACLLDFLGFFSDRHWRL